MSYNAALVISYGLPIADREKASLNVFSDGVTHFGKLAADGKCAEPEIFHRSYGGGFMIIKAEDTETIHEILALEETRRLIVNAEFTTMDFDFHIFNTGEELMENMAFYTTVGSDLGYL